VRPEGAGERAGYEGPADWLGFLLNTLGERLRVQTYAALEPFGLAARDLGALEAVAAFGPMSQVELGRNIGMDRTSVVQLVDRLQAAGWWVRAQSPTDRRVHLLQLTPEGALRLESARKIAADAERDFAREMSEADLSRLKAQLRRLL
jgi:DNA-binding MarR family transcriptional regulator